MKIIAIGDNVIDLYVDQNIMYPGGNALNVAVFSKRYGVEKSSYVGIIGDDLEGKHIEESLKKEEVDTSRIRRAIGETGKTEVVLNDEGERVFGSWNYGGVQSQLKINISREDLEYIKQYDILHSSVYSYLESELAMLSEYVPLSFDFSLKREGNYLEKVCPYVTYSFFSGSDLSKSECIELMDLAHSFGAENVIITRGDKSVLFSDGESLYEQSSLQTTIVDTLGAGDSFIAMFLTQYHLTKDPEKSLSKAVEAAAKTCTTFGAFGNGIKATKD